jgi:hypothetical protein
MQDEDWEPSITIKEILRVCQWSLDEPNPNSPAQAEAYHLFICNKPAYEVKIRELAAHHTEARFLAEHGETFVDPVTELNTGRPRPRGQDGVFDNGDRSLDSTGG